MQSFGGNDVYPTLEEKAAHLLYFMVKNHPFVDGNKRSGAFVFIWFLRKSGVSGARNINPSGLTAITLLIAESELMAFATIFEQTTTTKKTDAVFTVAVKKVIPVFAPPPSIKKEEARLPPECHH